MRWRPAAWAALVACATVLCGAPASAAESSESPDFRLLDPEITESSSMAVSRADPDLVFTINDSGDTARIFVVDTGSGQTVGVTQLDGVEHVDFEALALAPGGRLLVGDVGDNDAERDEVQIHMIDEPGRGEATARPRTLTLTYADGPRDAEAVLVRDGRIFVVSKRPFGGEVWRGPSVADFPASATFEQVASAPGTISDATVLDDGRVVLRNYTAAFVMSPDWDIAQTLMLPPTELGESAAAPPQGAWFYAGTEGESSPVHRIDVPPPGKGTEPPESPSTQAPSADSVGGESGTVGPVLLWTGLVAVVAGVAALLIRRRT